MALPTLEKTWQYAVNNIANSATPETRVDTALLLMKNALKAFGSNPWVVWGSCDGAGGAGSFGNNDGLDRWVDISDIVHNAPGSNHSWIVLRNPVTGVSICIDTNSLSPNVEYAGFYASEAGFNSDGTATTCPTAPDRVTLYNSGFIIRAPASNQTVVHLLHSTDGVETRVIMCQSSLAQFCLMLGVAADIPAGNTWGGKWYAAVGNTTTISVPTYSLFNDTASVNARDTVAMTMYMSCEGYGSATLGENMTVADEDTGVWPILPMGLFCGTVGHRGHKGRVVDMWWGSTTPAVGDTYPADASRQFVQLGDMIFPWNGSVPGIV